MNHTIGVARERDLQEMSGEVVAVQRMLKTLDALPVKFSVLDYLREFWMDKTHDQRIQRIGALYKGKEYTEQSFNEFVDEIRADYVSKYPKDIETLPVWNSFFASLADLLRYTYSPNRLHAISFDIPRPNSIVTLQEAKLHKKTTNR